MSNLATLQRAYDNQLPDDEFYEPDTVGNPEQEIRDGFAESGEVPYVNHTKQREMSMPAAEAFADALGSNEAWTEDMWRAVCGDQLAAFRLRRAAVDWWIADQADELRECRRGTLFAEE